MNYVKGKIVLTKDEKEELEKIENLLFEFVNKNRLIETQLGGAWSELYEFIENH